MTRPQLPMQPLVIDDHGVIRFTKNRAVRRLLDEASAARKCDMNDLALWSGCSADGASNEELAQFAQLIGYSVSGFGELSYVQEIKAYVEPDRLAEELLERLASDRKGLTGHPAEHSSDLQQRVTSAIRAELNHTDLTRKVDALRFAMQELLDQMYQLGVANADADDE